MEGKSVSCYVKLSQREQVLAEFEERGKLSEEKKRLLAYVDGLQNILKRNPYLNAGVGCGYQDFKDFACGRQFYVDKTHFYCRMGLQGCKSHADHETKKIWQDDTF